MTGPVSYQTTLPTDAITGCFVHKVPLGLTQSSWSQGPASGLIDVSLSRGQEGKNRAGRREQSIQIMGVSTKESDVIFIERVSGIKPPPDTQKWPLEAIRQTLMTEVVRSEWNINGSF